MDESYIPFHWDVQNGSTYCTKTYFLLLWIERSIYFEVIVYLVFVIISSSLGLVVPEDETKLHFKRPSFHLVSHISCPFEPQLQWLSRRLLWYSFVWVRIVGRLASNRSTFERSGNKPVFVLWLFVMVMGGRVICSFAAARTHPSQTDG